MITVGVEQDRFNARVKRFISESNLEADIVLKKIAFDLLREILRPEPYGTHPVWSGRARAGWYASMRGLGVNIGLNSRLKSTSQVGIGMREGSFKAKIGPMNWNKSIIMVNSVKYILFLEYGGSKQAPYGMARISMRKMRYKFRKDLKRGLTSRWRK